TFEAKLAGERCAGKPHAPFDEAGAGNRARSRDRSACNDVRGQRRIYSATAPALDPTGERGLETEHGLGIAAPAAGAVDRAGPSGHRATPRLYPRLSIGL